MSSGPASVLSLRLETAEESWVGDMEKLSTTEGLFRRQEGGDEEGRYIELNRLAKRRDILQPSEASSSLKNIEEGRLVSSRVPLTKLQKYLMFRFKDCSIFST